MNALEKRVIACFLILASFVMGNLSHRFSYRLNNLNGGKKDEPSDVKMFVKMLDEAGKHLVEAQKADRKKRFEEAADNYGVTCKDFRLLVMATYYKKCCAMFETKKYSATLDELIRFLKFDPEISEVYYSSGENVVGRMYVCLYDEVGVEDAETWLRKTMESQNDEGKKFSLALLNRFLYEACSITNQTDNTSEKNLINMLLHRLDEIDKNKANSDWRTR